MRCPACSAEVPASARYCPSCAQPIGSASQLPTGLATPSVAEAAQRRGTSDSPVGRIASSPSLDGGGFSPGTILGERYRIIGLVGRGGMGEVYRADDLKLGQPVALKFLPAKLASEPAFIERFYAEVRHARGVSHPNVCRVYDVGEIEGRHFLSMEYVDGEDLASLLRRIGRLPQDKAIEIAREMCAGLSAAHDKGVLHRDLKPGNVMIDGRGRAKITDFGLAVGVDDDKGGAEVSGTPAYMAPEQLAGKGSSVQSDIYALGLVLYELFTGRKAFEAATLAEWRRKHAEEQPTSPSTVTPGFDPVVERVILRCLEKDPKARPRSVTAVAAALPGGDPLAAAIAAGETPSPEMVAAAGDRGAITPRTARLVILAVVLLLGFVMFANRYTNLFEMVPLEKPPDALVDRAKEIVRKLGYPEEPADTAQGFHAAGEYLGFLEQRDATASRWKALATGWPAVHFWYRQSPRDLVAWNFFGSEFPAGLLIPGLVGPEDPPLGESGMVSLETSAGGNLFSFQAVPPQVDPSPAPTGEPDWAPLFAAAGLDPARFKPVTPTWNPLAASDRRAAWEGEYPGLPGVPLRIEAAGYRGRPVYFYTIGPWTRPRMMQAYKVSTGEKLSGMSWILMLVTTFCGGAYLARRNLRLGRGDRRGASRFATAVFAISAAAWIFGGTHVAAAAELGLVVMRVGWSLFLAGTVWMVYVAVEPYVRKYWPGVLIGWSRLLAGRWHDPLVGRDILVGVVFMAVGASISQMPGVVSHLLGSAAPTPSVQSELALMGLRGAAATFMMDLVVAVLLSVTGLFLMFLLRRVLRLQWLAAAAFVALIVLNSAAAWGTSSPLLGLSSSMLSGCLIVLVLTRFGFLAYVSGVALDMVVETFPLTSRLSAWYAGSGLFAFAFCLITLAWATRTALAGQPLFAGTRSDE